MSGIKTSAMAGLLTLSMAGSAGAADMLKYSYQPPPDVGEAPVEIGSGWYLRADANLAKDYGGQLSPDIPSSNRRNGWGADVGAGYKWNNWFRSDVTFGMHNITDAAQTNATVVCPYALTGETSQPAGILLGYLWDSLRETCNPVQSVTMHRTDMLLNGYLDLGDWWGVSPYVGAGVGLVALRTTGGLQYYKTSDHTVYNANLTPTGSWPHLWLDPFGNPITPQPAVSFAQQDWTTRISQTSYNLAWALMGGIAYDLSSRAKLDVSYRYANFGTYKSAVSPVTGATVTTNLHSQEIRVGFRYQVD